MKKTLAMAAALALPLTGLMAAPAQAVESPYKPAQVKWVKHAEVKGNHATVDAKYRCWGGNQNTHVWVSLKQGPQIASKTISELVATEGSSRLAKSWYDTNGTDPQEVYVVCNGHWQRQTFKLTRAAGTAKMSGRDKGKTFLQFCLYDSRVAAGPGAQPSAYVYKFINVRKVKKLDYNYDH